MLAPFRGRAALPLVLLVALLAGCDGGPRFPTDATLDTTSLDADAEVDVAEDTPDAPLLGRVCREDGQCDDGVMCTDDHCVEGRCVNNPVHDRCDDRVYCNGSEVCDVLRGCRNGEPVNCNDNFVCTSDRCNETTHACEHRPLDRDGDGDPDEHCEARECADGGVPESDSGAPGSCWRGHDCDDRDPRVSSMNPEICGDMVDNNCNGQVDMAETGGCRAPRYDTCMDPLDVSAGGVFALDMAALRRDYTTTCGFGSHDLVARFRLTEPRDLEIQGNSSTSTVTLALQTTCGSTMPADTLTCHSGFPGIVRRNSLPPGEYFLLVGSSGTGMVDLSVRFAPPTPPPTNDTCASATRLPGAGTYTGSTVGLRNDYALPCNPGSQADAVFEFTLTEPHDVTVSTDTMAFDSGVALVGECAPFTVLRCARGFGATTPSFRARSLPAGTYRIVAETGSVMGPFRLTLAIDPPTPPPPEDACPPAGATTPSVELNDGMPHTARLAMLEDDHTLSCDFRSARDAVYRLTLTEPRDVRVTARGTAGQTYLSFRNAPCSTTGSERRCLASPAGAMPSPDVEFTQRALPPGTYWVAVENSMNSDVTVQATLSPPSPVVTYTLAPAPASVAFTDICAMPGAGRVLMRQDDATVQIPAAGSTVTIPFPLRMYGVDVTPPVSVSTNGWMSLTRTGSTSLGGTIPGPAEPNLTIAPFWSDSYTRAAGICYLVTGTAPDRKFIVQWEDLHWCCTDDPMVHLTYQVVINEAPAGANNVIDVIYQRLDGGSMRTVAAGIENDDGSDGVPIPGPFTAPRAVRFTPSR